MNVIDELRDWVNDDGPKPYTYHITLKDAKELVAAMDAAREDTARLDSGVILTLDGLTYLDLRSAIDKARKKTK